MSPNGAVIGLAAAILVFVLGGPAHAAAANPYATGIQDEVMMQNLTCEDIERFLMKPLGDPMLGPATDILNQPQHSRETSATLFGEALTRLILVASNLPIADHPPNPDWRTRVSNDPILLLSGRRSCSVIVPRSAPAEVDACDGRCFQMGSSPPPEPDASGNVIPPCLPIGNMGAGSGLLPSYPGELKLLALFDHAAKYRNCRR